MQNFEGYQQLMSQARKIVITTHHNPDADALGSSLALDRYLKKKGHLTQVIVPSEYPNFLYWMNGNGEVLVYSEASKPMCQKHIQEAEVIFCLDFSALSRLQGLSEMVRNSPAKIVLIDHHKCPEIIADFQFWDDKASATAELIYQLIALAGDIKLMDQKMGELIYAGIVTDTSSFKHASTSKNSLLITANLMDLGIDFNKVQRLIYDSNSADRMFFLGYALKEKLKVLPQYRTAYFIITQAELDYYHAELGDTEGLVNYALAIKEVALAAVIIERNDCVKISFRSVGDFAVNELAQKHFGGGGHQNAAGCNCTTTVEKIEQDFLSLLPQYKEKLLAQNLW
jgi:bifunctional oligoribonuclease and PAP phosphatase NrnA